MMFLTVMLGHILAAQTQASERAVKPNILMMLADDLCEVLVAATAVTADAGVAGVLRQPSKAQMTG